MNTDTRWDWYLKALSGEKVAVHESEPQQGNYRMKVMSAWVPVAIWWDGERDEDGELLSDEKLVALVGFENNCREEDPGKIWTRVAHFPVTQKAYDQAFETGHWPDDAPEPVRGLGDNLPQTPLEAVEVEILGEREIVNEFLKTPVTTQEQADRIGPWTKRLLALRKRAEAQHDEEKRPFLEAGRAVDDRWRLPIAEIKEMIDALRGHIEAFLAERRREERERERKAAEEAHKLREEADKKESAAQRDELRRQAAEVEAQGAAEKVSAGRSGAKVTLRTERKAKVIDYKAAAVALLDLDGPISADLKAKIDQLANRVIRGGITPPGVEVVELEKAI